MEHNPLASLPVEIRRSARRRKTLSASVRDGRILVLVPAGLPAAEESELVARLVARVRRRSAGRGSPTPGDGELSRRATELSRQYLEGRAQPASVRWVDNQNTRWGSCTPATGTIRLSTTLHAMPQWVIDSVLLHELVHLIEPGHGPRFQGWMRRYPRSERARGYLEGYATAARHAAGDGVASTDPWGEDPDESTKS